MLCREPFLKAVLLGMTIWGVTACGVREIPPPAAPSKELPKLDDLPEGEAPAGMTRVVIDTPGESARVTEITGVSQGYATAGGHTAYASAMATRPLCGTPCIVNLEPGTHHLLFASTKDPSKASYAETEVRGGPVVIRHALGKTTEHNALRVPGNALFSLGFLSAMTGGVFLGVDAISSSDGSTSGSKLGDVGTPMVIAGLSSMVVGGVLAYLGRTEVQPGATTVFRASEAESPKKKIEGHVTRLVW